MKYNRYIAFENTHRSPARERASMRPGKQTMSRRPLYRNGCSVAHNSTGIGTSFSSDSVCLFLSVSRCSNGFARPAGLGSSSLELVGRLGRSSSNVKSGSASGEGPNGKSLAAVKKMMKNSTITL